MHDNPANFKTHNKPRFFYGYVIVIAAFLVFVSMYGSFFCYGVFLKPILMEFGWSRASMSGAYALAMIIHGILGIFMGNITDRIGPRIVIAVCGFFLGLGYILMSQVQSIWQLYLFYGVIIGIGVSGGWVSLLSTVARWFSLRRTVMSGIVLTGTGVGSLIIPPVATWLIEIYSWRTTFIILAIALLLIVAVAALLLKKDPSQMGLLPYGVSSDNPSRSRPVAGYTLKESSRTRQFWLVCSAFACFGFAMFAVNVHITPHTADLGYSAVVAAAVLSSAGISSIVGRVLIGHIADRIGNQRMMIIGMLLLTVDLFCLVVFRDIRALYALAVIFGFAYGGIGSSESPLIARLFGLKSHGLIFGISDFFFTLGASIGPVVAGYVFDITGSYQLAFLFGAIIAAFGTVLLIIVRPLKGRMPDKSLSV
jgi:MFS family permease